MGREELASLRAQALQETTRATRKLARLRREKGVTDFEGIDPRVSRETLKRYTTKQTLSYIARVKAFTSRRTQYVGDSQGKPMSGEAFRRYKRAEAKVNAARTALRDSIAGVKLPDSEMTVGQHMQLFGTDETRPHMLTNANVNNMNRSPRNFMSQAAMEKIMKRLEREASSQGRASMVRDWREQAERMIDDIGNKGVAKTLKNLTDKQFETLWVGTGFVSSFVSWYDMQQKGLMSQALIDDVSFEVKSLIRWAGKL